MFLDGHIERGISRRLGENKCSRLTGLQQMMSFVKDDEVSYQKPTHSMLSIKLCLHRKATYHGTGKPAAVRLLTQH